MRQRLDAVYAALLAVYNTDDLSACIDADVAFHQAIAEASHNMLIGHLTSSLMRVIHGHISTNLEHLHTRAPRWNLLEGQHQAIWQAIREHKPQEAAAAASDHIKFVRQSIEDNAQEGERRSSALRRMGDVA